MKRKQFIKENLALGFGALFAPSLIGGVSLKRAQRPNAEVIKNKFEVYKLVSDGIIGNPLLVECTRIADNVSKIENQEPIFLFPELSYFKLLLGATYPKRIISSGITISEGDFHISQHHETLLEYSNCKSVKYSLRHYPCDENIRVTIYGSEGKIECYANSGYAVYGTSGLISSVGEYGEVFGSSDSNDEKATFYKAFNNESDEKSLAEFCSRSLNFKKIVFLDENGRFSFETERDNP